MKKTYNTPACELITLREEDIIRTSGGYSGKEIDGNGKDPTDLPFVKNQ